VRILALFRTNASHFLRNQALRGLIEAYYCNIEVSKVLEAAAKPLEAPSKALEWLDKALEEVSRAGETLDKRGETRSKAK